MADPRKVWGTDPQYLKAAFSVLGLSEIAGRLHEPKILAMYAASGHPEIKDDETAWCAAFVGWCLVKGNLPNTGSLLAISYAKYGTAVPKSGKIPRGAIAVWKRTGGNHVNFVLDDDGTYVTCLGGNQENGKGGGVTISKRSKAQALAYRMPVAVAAVEAVVDTDPLNTDNDKPAVLPPAPAQTAVVIGRATAGVTTVATVAGQVAKASLDNVSDVATQVSDVVDKSGNVVEVAKKVVVVPKPGFWPGVLHFVTSPGFVISALLLAGAMWFLIWFIQREHAKARQQ